MELNDTVARIAPQEQTRIFDFCDRISAPPARETSPSHLKRASPHSRSRPVRIAASCSARPGWFTV
jgi:hypothetical protein